MKKNLILTLAAIMVSAAFAMAQQNKPLMPQMIHVEGGTFKMGNNDGTKDELPVHEVTLTSYYFGKYEVTYMDFKRFVDATGYKTDAEQPDSVNFKHGLPPRGVNNGTWKMDNKGMPVEPSDSMKPVGNISWNDAVAYLDWLSRETGKKFRLPTEAEWEFAARGGIKTKGFTYAGGNIVDEVAWYLSNSDRRAHTIGTRMANELDIYDLSGNIQEWCSDWYGELYYKTSPGIDPAGPDQGSKRTIRGGSWGSEKDRMRLTYRNRSFPYNSALDFGFRPAMTDVEAARKVAPKTEGGLMKDFDTKGFVDVYGIYFDVSKYVVKPESYAAIDQVAQYLSEHPKTRIMIEGHTDNTGNADKNQVLSENRAKAIKEAIVKKGIDGSQMETMGYGAAKPVADNKTTEGRTQNRRVTIKKL